MFLPGGFHRLGSLVVTSSVSDINYFKLNFSRLIAQFQWIQKIIVDTMNLSVIIYFPLEFEEVN